MKATAIEDLGHDTNHVVSSGKKIKTGRNRGKRQKETRGTWMRVCAIERNPDLYLTSLNTAWVTVLIRDFGMAVGRLDNGFSHAFYVLKE